MIAPVPSSRSLAHPPHPQCWTAFTLLGNGNAKRHIEQQLAILRLEPAARSWGGLRFEAEILVDAENIAT